MSEGNHIEPARHTKGLGLYSVGDGAGGSFRQRNAQMTPVWLHTEAWVGDAAARGEGWADAAA